MADESQRVDQLAHEARGLKRGVEVARALGLVALDRIKKLRKRVDQEHGLNVLQLAQGSNFLCGKGPPPPSLGNPGDVYLDTDSGDLFRQEAD